MKNEINEKINKNKIKSMQQINNIILKTLYYKSPLINVVKSNEKSALI